MAICPVCKSTLEHTHESLDPLWLDDPMLTPQGLSGSGYYGETPIRWTHIKQLQEYYQALAEELSVTIPTWLAVGLGVPAQNAHIDQLRQVVEILLSTAGLTLAEYFQGDKYGNTYSTTQVDWTNCVRISDLPLLPVGPIRALDIEELRRGFEPNPKLIYNIPYVIGTTDNYTGYKLPTAGTSDATHIEVDVSELSPNIVDNYDTKITTYTDDVASYYDVDQDKTFNIKILIIPPEDFWSTSERLSLKVFNKTMQDTAFTTEEVYLTENSTLDTTFYQYAVVSEATFGPIEFIDEEEIESNYSLFACVCDLREYGSSNKSFLLSQVGSTFLRSHFPYTIKKYKAVRSRILGVSNGSSNQSFDIRSVTGIIAENLNAYFLAGVDSIGVNIFVSGVKWTQVDAFSESQERCFMVVDGIVTFGELDNIPPLDAQILLYLGPHVANKNRWEYIDDAVLPTTGIQGPTNRQVQYAPPNTLLFTKEYYPTLGHVFPMNLTTILTTQIQETTTIPSNPSASETVVTQATTINLSTNCTLGQAADKYVVSADSATFTHSDTALISLADAHPATSLRCYPLSDIYTKVGELAYSNFCASHVNYVGQYSYTRGSTYKNAYTITETWTWRNDLALPSKGVSTFYGPYGSRVLVEADGSWNVPHDVSAVGYYTNTQGSVFAAEDYQYDKWTVLFDTSTYGVLTLVHKCYALNYVNPYTAGTFTKARSYLYGYPVTFSIHYQTKFLTTDLITMNSIFTSAYGVPFVPSSPCIVTVEVK